MIPVSNVSEAYVPPNGISMWVCPSMPPGMTYFPAASMTVSAERATSRPSCDPGARTAAIVSPSTRTSCSEEPSAVTTVPFVISVVIETPYGATIRV